VNPLSKKYSLVIFLLALAVLSISILALAESYTIKTSSDKFRGTFLVNQSNFTLYYFQNDSTANGASTCYEECAVLYTSFYVPNFSTPENLNPNDFGTETRTDGKKQTTFKGWPLYYYSRDKAAGEFNGDGGAWHIIDPDNQPQVI
jgi:predicted lipoprotein with Yx(FWY)xxD motif